MKFTKEKNILSFTTFFRGDDRTYTIDINTGRAYGYGKVKKPISMLPRTISNYFWEERRTSSVMYVLWSDYDTLTACYDDGSTYLTRFINRLKLADRLDSVSAPYMTGTILVADEAHMDLLSKNFTKLLARGKEILEEYNNQRGWLHLNESSVTDSDFGRYFWKEYNKESFEDLHLNTERLSNDMLKFCKQVWSSDNSSLYGSIRKHMAELVYFLPRGLWDFAEQESEITRKMNNLIKFTDGLGIKIEKSDFFKQYVSAKKDYYINKEKIDNNALRNNQLQYKETLTYSNDKYTTVIPVTKAEFLTEANAQSNCLASYINSVIDGNTNIVFVRAKDNPDKPLVTCEVSNKATQINQYLKSYNNYVSRTADSDLYHFYCEFAEHIAKVRKLGSNTTVGCAWLGN